MKSKTKALTLSYSDYGGAGSSAIRFHLQILRLGYDSRAIVLFNKNHNTNVYSVLNKSVKYYLIRIYEKLQDYIGFFSSKYEFHNRGSFISSSLEIINKLNKIDYEPDIIFVAWNSKFLSLNSIQEIQKKFNAKVYIWIFDKEPFTGGCHYTNSCNGYLNKCDSCPAVSNIYKSLPKKNFNLKNNLYTQINPTFLYTDKWLKVFFENAALLKNRNSNFIPGVFSSNSSSSEVPFYKMDSAKKIELKQKYNIPLNKCCICFAALNLNDERKGFSFFKESLIALQKNYDINFHAVVMGRGLPSIKEIDDSNITFTGEVAEPKIRNEFYNCSDFFVSTPIEDMGPATLAEAMLCGLIPISFPTGIAMNCISSENGILCKGFDSNELARHIVFLDNLSPSKKSEMSLNSVVKMVNYYSIAESDKQMLKLLG